jgi:hypothetical protein
LLVTHAGASKTGFPPARNQKDALNRPGARPDGNLPKTLRMPAAKKTNPKVSLAVITGGHHVARLPAMIHRLLLSCLAAAALTATGCRLLSKKSDQPKDSGAIASETEDSLKKRYIERRTSELVAQGLAAEAARTQATEEFRQKYEYTGAAKK